MKGVFFSSRSLGSCHRLSVVLDRSLPDSQVGRPGSNLLDIITTHDLLKLVQER